MEYNAKTDKIDLDEDPKKMMKRIVARFEEIEMVARNAKNNPGLMYSKMLKINKLGQELKRFMSKYVRAVEKKHGF